MKPKSRRLSNNTRKYSHGTAVNAKQNEPASRYDFAKLSEALDVAWPKAEEEVVDTAPCSNSNAASDESASVYDFSKLSEALNVVGNKHKDASAKRYKARREQQALMRCKLYQEEILEMETKGQIHCIYLEKEHGCSRYSIWTEEKIGLLSQHKFFLD
jgi:hypothetical protein